MNRRLLEGTNHSNWTRESAGSNKAWVYIPENASVKVTPNCLNLSEIEQKSENKEEVNSSESKKIRFEEIMNNMLEKK